MALPVYYLNQSWKQTFGERTNRIVLRAFVIFTTVIYEFKNRETKNRTQSDDEFMEKENRVIMENLFESLILDLYSKEQGDVNLTKSTVMNSLSFNLSPYVKLLPKFDAIPVIISCLRQDDIRMVKMAVDTLTLLCQWNSSFVNTITNYMFSSTLYTLLARLQYNIVHNIRINHTTRTLRSTLLARLRSPRRDEDSDEEEERKRNGFILDTTDSFFNDLCRSEDGSMTTLQTIFDCSEDDGQLQVLRSVLLLIVYMEGGKKQTSSQLITELHASDCESILMGIYFIPVSYRYVVPLHWNEG